MSCRGYLGKSCFGRRQQQADVTEGNLALLDLREFVIGCRLHNLSAALLFRCASRRSHRGSESIGLPCYIQH